MGKQRQLLKEIIDWFRLLTNRNDSSYSKCFLRDIIRERFEQSNNKKDLTRRILFDALLSDDDVLNLLRIIFDNKKRK